MDLEKALDQLYGGVRKPPIDPLTIPCRETSDPEKLCRHPLLSVQLVTYNHEPYIRECIESVLMQRTDFEFEIVIGEDCSQDRTREICFEYQRKHPDKIRVLWADENVYNKGGNATRTRWRCRGEYIALLEGDDYWTDPLKLQKQVDLMRKTGAICCVANYQIRQRDGRLINNCYYHDTLLTHDDMFLFYPHTATHMLKLDDLKHVWDDYPSLRTTLDIALMHCIIARGKMCHLQDAVSVYRITGGGIATSLTPQTKCLTELRTYLDLYLHGPRDVRRRFAARVVTGAAYFCKRDTPGWDRKKMEQYGRMLLWIVVHVGLPNFYDLRTMRAVLRFVRFRLGLTV